MIAYGLSPALPPVAARGGLSSEIRIETLLRKAAIGSALPIRLSQHALRNSMALESTFYE